MPQISEQGPLTPREQAMTPLGRILFNLSNVSDDGDRHLEITRW